MPPRQLRPATNTTAPTSCGAHSVRKPERIPTPAAGVRRGGPRSPGRLQPIHPLVDDHARLAYSKVLQRDRDGLKRPSWNELSPTSWPGASSRSNECSPTIPLAGRRPQEGARRPRHRPGTHPAARRSGQGGAEPTAPSSRNGAVAKSSPAPNRAAAAHPGSRHSTGLEHDNAERRGSALGGCRRTSRLSPTGWPGTPGSRKTTASHGPPPVDPGPLRRDVPIYMLLSVASTGRT